MDGDRKDELTYVARSDIHGRGLYARVSIRRGTVIGHIEGRPTTRNGAYTLWLPEGGFSVTCRLRFINHSSSPNACYYEDGSVVALRNIRPDEEITHDYSAGSGEEAF